MRHISLAHHYVVPSKMLRKSAGCIWLKFSQAIKFIQAWWTWELSKGEELKGWDYSPDGALERCLTSDCSSEAWYLFPLICNKVFLNKYFHLTFPLREPVQLKIFTSCFQLKNKSPLIPLSEINQKPVKNGLVVWSILAEK